MMARDAKPSRMCEMTELELRGVSKDFSGLRALQNVSLSLRRGERVTLIGPNGSGKTTLFNVISGFLKPSVGRIYLFGRDVTDLTAFRRSRLGLGRGFQITNLFPELTIRKTLMLAAIRRQRRDYEWFRVFDPSDETTASVERSLADWGFAGREEKRVGELPYGEQRKLDICLTLLMEPTALLLDEPTAGLSALESSEIVEIIAGLPPSLTCFFVTHDLRFGFEIADRVVGLYQGQVVVEGTPDEVQNDKLFRSMYF